MHVSRYANYAPIPESGGTPEGDALYAARLAADDKLRAETADEFMSAQRFAAILLVAAFTVGIILTVLS
jgi:hypothetical protein